MAYNPYGGKPGYFGGGGSQWQQHQNRRPPHGAGPPADDRFAFAAPTYGPPPAYGSYPGAAAGPPGMGTPPGLGKSSDLPHSLLQLWYMMILTRTSSVSTGPPPGMSAPGMAPPPGVQQPHIAQANRPSGLPASFQPPPNLPNINFNAPVIRLGTTAPSSKPSGPGGPGARKDDGSSSRSGMGGDHNNNQSRSGGGSRDIAILLPPNKDEIRRTLYIGGITEGVGGALGVEKVLGSVANLRRWDKAIGADGKECTFGFAQFEDVDSLAVAVEVLKDIDVPVKKQTQSEPRTAAATAENGDDKKEANSDGDDKTMTDADSETHEYPGLQKRKLVVRADPVTLSFLESYKESRGHDALPASRIEAAKSALKEAVRHLFYPPIVHAAKDADGDVAMGEASAQANENVEVVNIPLAQEDELADIPAEMRETVAAEIAAFRERSHKRDLERLRQEEEFEAAERARNGLTRPSRLDSSPKHSANSIPVGPRGSFPHAPSGPRGQKVSGFVNGGTTNGEIVINRNDDVTDVSDKELWRREVKKKTAEEEKLFLEAERRWVNRERSRAAALEREKEREASEREKERKNNDSLAVRFKEWDDDRESSRKSELYYRDRSAWIRERDVFRAREVQQDDADRRAELSERAKEEAEKEQAKGLADSFLERQAIEMQQREAAAVAAPQPFKVKLKMQSAKSGPKRRTVAEVEGLLEDEEDNQATKRQLIPIKFESMGLTDEENQEAVRALAQEIPSDKNGLWAWDVKWDHLDETTIEEKLRPFIEKKIVEFLGVQEQLLVDVVEEHLKKKAKPAEIVEELGEALDEAEDLVRKVWRMVIFYTECEKRGFSA
ncbi:hypothetical protein MKZ38_005099 [Zalerion maritima]|uniref:PWI domain-containing protein n=1 Tax=Zalerion maritima TaxID=339359 RepID=A0AAD5RLK7_9PEZI|nr:hypothetical protein MKZ38_005099 [Zalerion maritima]